MENLNLLFKRFHTHWKMTGLNQLKVDILIIMRKESILYKKDKALFKTDVTISNSMRKAGHHYAKQKSIVMRKGDDGKGRFYMRRGEDMSQLSEEDVDAFLNRRYNTFDEFADGIFDLYIMTFDNDVSKWKETAECTCPSFADNFICKHVMCIAYKLGLEKYREEHLLFPANKQGRPPKATPALVVDPK